MAPAPSKMAPSPGPPLPPTLNQLTDDSLLIILSFLPLSQLLSQVNLTCKRWHSLLPHLLHPHTSLALTAAHTSPVTCQLFLFPQKASRRRLYSGILPAHRNGPFKARPPTGNCTKLNHLVILYRRPPPCASFSQYLTGFFPKLTHLSLIDLSLPHQDLLHLLTFYGDKLIFIALKNIAFTDQCTNRRELYSVVWSVLDSMPLLRHLGLALCERAPNLGTALGTVLPRLTCFTLDASQADLHSIMRQFTGRKLNELKLCNWQLALQGSRLPDLLNLSFTRSLTRLTPNINFKSFTGKEGGVTVSLLMTIVRQCPLLQYLNLYIDISVTFDGLLPSLARLPRLSCLWLKSRNEAFIQAPPDGTQPLIALRRLTLEVRFHPKLVSIVRNLCPNLQKFYLDRASL